MMDKTGAIRMNVGGGVVYDSSAAAEYEEAMWKARFASLPG
jgi:para-aminobenzoate synthetase component 1